MTNAEITFIVVEDNLDYQIEVLNQLAKADFSPEKNLGTAGTYDDAKELLEQHSNDLDLVFLDLNIPRNPADPKPEDKHGTALLDLIHQGLNRRPGVYIRVIIVSGQDLAANEAMKSVMMSHYASTLVGVVEKAAMVQMLKANLKRLRQDPILKALKRLGIPLESEWETLIDTNRPALDRLSAGRAISIRIAQNEIDYREGIEHSHPEFDDNLGGIYFHLINRFRSIDLEGTPKVSLASVTSDGKWGCFLWRGVLIDHFRTINTYWNAFKHLPERPYHNPTQDTDDWAIPVSLMQRARNGEIVLNLVELAVRDLLEWYLPWHEQVIAKQEP